MNEIDPRIPAQYAKFWIPFVSCIELVHITSKKALAEIQRCGFIEPKDPAPRQWAGLKAVFLADPTDPLFPESVANVLAHVRAKGSELVRLSIALPKPLFRSTDPERTFQVISLDPIPYHLVTKVQGVLD